jgi:hypothetical protein
MSNTSWLRFVGIVVACTGLVIASVSPALSQMMCTALNATRCELDADAKFALCASYCARYDNACTDECDDSHDTAVRFCQITGTLCAEIERSKQAFSLPTGREGPR